MPELPGDISNEVGFQLIEMGTIRALREFEFAEGVEGVLREGHGTLHGAAGRS